ncbi:MAG TPA: DUF6311 domain-containing protein [Candidatus Omnitrophota bacterium]|nr:DUF6311 domain-containing protein [Candidatus Omnitrophota bacterium]
METSRKKLSGIVNDLDPFWKLVLEITLFALIGIFSFLAIYGTAPLNPLHTDWAKSRTDLTQHYLGWSFYRADPWAFPIGKFTTFGYPYGNTIVFTDSIPLFAILFKAARPLLPPDFQYFGLWELLCFALQGIFAGLLLKRFIKNPYLLLVCVPFFTFSPIFISRAFRHCALSGHWIILLALYLFFESKNDRSSALPWTIACLLALLVHSYILFMVLVIFLAFELNHLIADKKPSLSLFRLSVAFVSLLLVGWIVGVLYIGGDIETGSFGYFSMNLNALFNPMGWSRFGLPDLPVASKGQAAGVGFEYLGLGMIILLCLLAILALFFRLRSDRQAANRVYKQYLPGLIFTCVILIGFALSNKIYFNGLALLNIPLSPKVASLLSILRASGRLFWPVYYLIYLCVLSVLYGLLKGQVRNRYILLLLAFMLAVQIGDMSGELSKRRAFFPGKVYHSPLTSSFWRTAPDHYRHIVILPPLPQEDKVMEKLNMYALYALEYKMTINTGYFARYPFTMMNKYAREVSADLKDGKIDKEWIFIVKDQALMQDLLRSPALKEKARFLKVDGMDIIVKK